MPMQDTCFQNLKLFANGTINSFDLENLSFNSFVYDDPLNWISKRNIFFIKI